MRRALRILTATILALTLILALLSFRWAAQIPVGHTAIIIYRSGIEILRSSMGRPGGGITEDTMFASFFRAPSFYSSGMFTLMLIPWWMLLPAVTIGTVAVWILTRRTRKPATAFPVETTP